MKLRTWLSLTFGGFLCSTLMIVGVTSVTIADLTERITTVNHAGALSRRIDAVERSRRAYQNSGLEDALDATRRLISEAWPEMERLRSLPGTDLRHDQLVQSLQASFEEYGALLDAYADSEEKKSAAHEKMTIELSRLKSIASSVKKAKEREYHRTFASTEPMAEIEKQLRAALRLTALANEIIVLEASIERSIALFTAGSHKNATSIYIYIGEIAEISSGIRRIEKTTASPETERSASTFSENLGASGNQLQSDFDEFRRASLVQAHRALEMAGIAIQVTDLIRDINARQAIKSMESATQTSQLSTAGIVISLLLGILAVLMIRRRISQPIVELTESMQQMSQGQLDIAVPGQDRSDELGVMAKTMEVFRAKSHEALRLASEKLDAERRLAREKAEAGFLEQSLQHEKELNSQQRQFVSMVSHEFRTPLALIDGRAQRLLRKGHEESVRVDGLEKIRASVRRLLGLMETMLSQSALDAGSIELAPCDTDLRSLVKDVCASQQELSPGHKIEVHVDALPTDFYCDAKLLYQAVTNLLSNAVKYSPDGKVVQVTGVVADDEMLIAFRDHGVGIPKSEISKLFKRFFRASTSSGIEGTGIGLNFVKRLVELHGGDIVVSSEEGRGSTFTIRLPRGKRTCQQRSKPSLEVVNK